MFKRKIDVSLFAIITRHFGGSRHNEIYLLGNFTNLMVGLRGVEETAKRPGLFKGDKV